MKRVLFILFILIFAISLMACTDARRASYMSYGKDHKVTVYNGGVLVREYVSTGKVISIEDSDGWQFMDAKTGKLVRVSGDVIIEVID